MKLMTAQMKVSKLVTHTHIIMCAMLQYFCLQGSQLGGREGHGGGVNHGTKKIDLT